MELRLLALLSFLQFFPILASLEGPTLSLDPPHNEFFEGEKLTLRCSAPENKSLTGYQFFSEGTGKQIYRTQPDAYMEGQLRLTAQLTTSGIYSCAYLQTISGQETPSQKSPPTSVQVKAAPLAPSLSLNLNHDKTSVGLLCSVPASVANVTGFQYFGDVGVGIAVLSSSKDSYIYNLTVTRPEVSGSYRCSYSVYLSGRNVQAKWSEPVTISLGGSWMREFVVGGLFFTLSSLIFLITYFLMKREGSQWSHRKEIQAPNRTSKSLQHASSQSAGDPQNQVNISLLPE